MTNLCATYNIEHKLIFYIAMHEIRVLNKLRKVANGSNARAGGSISDSKAWLLDVGTLLGMFSDIDTDMLLTNCQVWAVPEGRRVGRVEGLEKFGTGRKEIG